MRLKKPYLYLILPIFLILTAYYLFFTAAGATSIIKLFLSRYIAPESLSFSRAQGSIAQAVSYENIVLDSLDFLPGGSVLKVQKLKISFSSLSLSSLELDINNARLVMPNFDTVLFYGSLKQGDLDINVYSKSISAAEILNLFIKDDKAQKISGVIADFDAYIKGRLSEPQLKGEFNIIELSRNGFSLLNTPVIFDLRLKDIDKGLKVSGPVLLKGGNVSATKIIPVDLKESRIIFDGLPQSPILDLAGRSVVEQVKIDINLSGTPQKPELKLSSEPPHPEKILLLMLLTGKSWKSTEGMFSQGQLSADLAKDFIDYFFFAGAGARLAQGLGINDLSLILEKDKKGIGFKKAISDKVDASYAVEQDKTKKEEAGLTQKVGTEYKITDSISIKAEKDLKQEDKSKEAQDKQKADDKVMINIKKKF
ncbi:MAG: translocation/assembly module TamB domain-containing protein [Candidatus Omnitrophica bacterium]|nr:translocation/assembly module TamB domain-containing protein [Candidatus Omnitrophota bacterium]